MIQLSEEQMNNLGKEALVILIACKHSIASTCLSYHIHEIITRISFRSRNSRDSHYKL